MPCTATFAQVSVVWIVDAVLSKAWIAFMMGALYAWTSDPLQSSRVLSTRLFLSLKETSDTTMWVGAEAFFRTLLIVSRMAIGLWLVLRLSFEVVITSVLSCRVGRTGRGGIGGGPGLAGFVFGGLAGFWGFLGLFPPRTSDQSGWVGAVGALLLFQALWTMMVRASILLSVLVRVEASDFRSFVISACSFLIVLRRWAFSISVVVVGLLN